ncbi:hypothetical protein [Kocuria rhizophila]|uniref:hypothetical protein n=1 Tax=Kocuria rhizophila TaxID=72000 RepID=UPI003D6F41DE
MDETVFIVEMEATCASQVSEEAVAVMRSELDGLEPQIDPTGDGFRVTLCIADAPNGFFTGVEAVTTSAVARLTVATGVAELEGVQYTQLHVTTDRAHATPGPAAGAHQGEAAQL